MAFFPIKYNTASESNSLSKGNWWVGTGDKGKGPTSTTGYYNSLEPPAGGYAVYQNQSSGGPSIGVCENDSDLIETVNKISNNNFTTVAEALTYAASNDNLLVDDGKTFPYLVSTENLVFCVDGRFIPSHPRSGNSWYDISPNSNNGSLINSPSHNQNGYLEFDGLNDYATFTLAGVNLDSGCTIEGWVKRRSTPTNWRTFFNVKSASSNTPFFEFRSSANTQAIYADYYNGTDYTTGSASLPTGEWGHAVATYDGNGNIKFYFNGQLVATRTGVPAFSMGNNPRLTIGRAYSNDRYTDIDVQGVRIYDAPLSAENIWKNYMGGNIPSSGLKMAFAVPHQVSNHSGGWNFDLAGQYSNLNTWGYAHGDLNGDFDGLTEFTYCLWIKVYSHHTGYSQTPFNKYSGTSTAVVRLYDFGNYNNNGGNGNLGWYMNVGGVWTSVGSNFGKTTVGETLFYCIQFNSTQSGQTWVNGAKHGSRSRRTGSVASNTTNFYIVNSDYGGEQYTKVKEAYVYDRELTDQEIIEIYNSTRGKYGV